MRDLTQQTLRALTEAAATIAPGGKQKSFGSRAYASYILAEKDSRQPRSLAVAFLKPVREGDMLHDAIAALTSTRAIWTRCITTARRRRRVCSMLWRAQDHWQTS